MKRARLVITASWQRIGLIVLLFSLSLHTAFAHDSTEVTTKVYLRTNSLEVRVTLAAQTAKLLLEADGHGVASLATPADVNAARPRLADCAARLFQVSSGGRTLSLTETNVTSSVEDHLEMKLVYPRPAAGPLRFDAVHLAKLPADEPYGALVTVVDLANNSFLGQQLLTARERSLEVKVPAFTVSRSNAPAPPLRK